MYWLASRCVCARLLTPLFGRQLDRDCKGVIGFKEYLQGVHVLQRGSRQDLLKFLFAGARVTTPASPPCCSLTFVFICCVCVRLAHCAVHDENMDGELSKQELFRFFLASLRVSVNENIEQSTPSLERLARNACAHSRELCRVYPQ